MAGLARKQEIAFREYNEANQQCRAIEQLTRTALAILLTAEGALIGYIQNLGLLEFENSLITFFGVVLSFGSADLIRRSQLYYRAYILRARKIERVIGLRLYRSGKKFIRRVDKRSNFRRFLAWPHIALTNKDMLAIMARTPGYIFGGLFVMQIVLLYASHN